jgi:Skp family chaperone for outer membrane proteins
VRNAGCGGILTEPKEIGGGGAMKKVFGSLCVAVLLAGASSVGFAAEAKIGYVSLPRVFEGYQKYKDAEQMMAERRKPLHDLANEVQELQFKDVSALSEQGKKEVMAQITSKRQTLDAQADEVAKEADRMLREILKDVETVSDEIRKKEKFAYIVDERLIISGPEDMDITDRLVSILNTRYKKK